MYDRSPPLAYSMDGQWLLYWVDIGCTTGRRSRTCSTVRRAVLVEIAASQLSCDRLRVVAHVSLASQRCYRTAAETGTGGNELRRLPQAHHRPLLTESDWWVLAWGLSEMLVLWMSTWWGGVVTVRQGWSSTLPARLPTVRSIFRLILSLFTARCFPDSLTRGSASAPRWVEIPMPVLQLPQCLLFPKHYNIQGGSKK